MFTMQNAGEEDEEKSGYFFKLTRGDCVPGKYSSFACAANIDSISTLKWIIIKAFNSVFHWLDFFYDNVMVYMCVKWFFCTQK